MALDPQYLDAIKGFEGYSPNASWDYKQYSSGYGTKARPGEAIDQAEAEKRFAAAIDQAAAHVDSVNPNLPPGVRAALTSLTYNAGPGWAQSGLGAAVKAGNLEAAKGIFPQYNKAGGEVNKGLVARRGKEFLDYIFTLPGTRRFGEAAIGTNYDIQRITKNILFDEKIWGSNHLTLGQAYDIAPNGNQSAIHWDLVCIGADVMLDGELIRKGRKFVPEQLLPLNPENF